MRVLLAPVLSLTAILCHLAPGAQPSVFLNVKGQQHSCHVLGVIPTADPRLLEYADAVFQELALSKQVVVMMPQCDPAILEENFPYHGKGNLETLFSNVNFLALDDLCRQYLGRSAWDFMRIQPLALRSLLDHRVVHHTGNKTAEDLLCLLAKEQGLPVSYNLSPDLCSAIETIPVGLQADMLTTYVARVTTPDYDAALTKHYLDNHVEGLSRMVERAEHLEYQIQMRDQWVDHIVQILADPKYDSAFVLLDATLLGGRRGILSRLAESSLHFDSLDAGLRHVGPVNSSNPWLRGSTFAFQSDQVTTEYYELESAYSEASLDSVLTHWYPLVSHAGGFTGRMPTRPAFSMDRSQASDDFLTVHLFKCEDLAVNSFYSISYTTYPKSFRSDQGTSEFFRQIVAQAVSSIQGVLLSDIDISTPPVQAREIEIEVQEDFIVRSRFYFVDNRFYQVMVGNSKRTAYSAKDNAFLGSLQIVDQKSAPWHTINLGTLSAELPRTPSRLIKVVDDGVLSYNYNTSDPNTGLDYTVCYTPYPPGNVNKSDDELYNGMVNAAVKTLNGTLLLDSPFPLGNFHGRDIEIAVRENSYSRMRFFMLDNRLVQLIVSGEGESIFSTYAERFLDSLSAQPIN